MGAIEYATDGGREAVYVEMREAEAACKRLGVRCVQRDARGIWRPATPWLATTPTASRTGADADRRRKSQVLIAWSSVDDEARRRLRLAAAERETHRR